MAASAPIVVITSKPERKWRLSQVDGGGWSTQTITVITHAHDHERASLMTECQLILYAVLCPLHRPVPSRRLFKRVCTQPHVVYDISTASGAIAICTSTDATAIQCVGKKNSTNASGWLVSRWSLQAGWRGRRQHKATPHIVVGHIYKRQYLWKYQR